MSLTGYSKNTRRGILTQGFRTDMSPLEMISTVLDIGVCLKHCNNTTPMQQVIHHCRARLERRKTVVPALTPREALCLLSLAFLVCLALEALDCEATAASACA